MKHHDMRWYETIEPFTRYKGKIRFNGWSDEKDNIPRVFHGDVFRNSWQSTIDSNSRFKMYRPFDIQVIVLFSIFVFYVL